MCTCRQNLLAETGRVRLNRVVLAPVAGVKLAEIGEARPGLRWIAHPSATVTRRIRRRGDHGIRRSNHCVRECRVIRCDRGDYRVLPTIAHGLRVHRAPGIPRALSRGSRHARYRGADDFAKLGQSVSRGR
jgi:hypothetical protein